MNLINYLSNASIPLIILIIIFYGFFEKNNNVFENFTDGVREGIKIIINIFPTLIALFIAIGILRSSGILDFIINLFIPIINFLKIQKEIIPLAILRPLSGSAAIAIATDIMNNYGVDSLIGKMASVIMGSTETTFYTIAVYTSCVKIKNTRGVVFIALFADLISIIISIIVCNFMW
jgi:spore maturation protein B